MPEINDQLAKLGIKVPKILLPVKKINLQKWAVIACDQFTQDSGYWEKVAAFAGDAPSTLNLIYPEVYLDRDDRADRIKHIHETMRAYLKHIYQEDAIFNPPRQAGAFVERTTTHGVRRGVVLAVDLESYDWRDGAESLVRATETTVPERLPPRVEIRRNAALDLPHIMLFIDDVENILMPVLQKMLVKAPIVYDTPLMLEGGRIRCRLFYRKNDWAIIADIFEHLARTSINHYNIQKPFIFAVGDGNHSLAAAKAVWDEYKAAHAGNADIDNHPARYAMAEVVNIHDPAVVFEPIHRFVFNAGIDKILGLLAALPGFSSRETCGTEELKRMVFDVNAPESRCGIVSGGRCVVVNYSGGKGGKFATVDIDPLLENLEIDYIHGEAELLRLAAAENSRGTGILLPPVDKSGLFKTIVDSGVLPRKSFSMGEAREKRFYIEAAKLFA
ncbi:MAG: DUF1015 domain-containing protein [Spirochaetaceae bacterium]|jgi:uncharacterized protein (DUF1015 family)|nr:DUF1015 domain-containing protein [Spirochaetaceae bacterium]